MSTAAHSTRRRKRSPLENVDAVLQSRLAPIVELVGQDPRRTVGAAVVYGNNGIFQLPGFRDGRNGVHQRRKV